MVDILALDIASRLGWARGRVGDAPTFGTVNFGTTDTVFAAAMMWILDTIALDPPDAVIIEKMLPPQAMTGETSRAVRDRLAGLQGIMRGVAALRGIPVSEATVVQIRAHFIGDSSLRRKAAKTAVIERCRALGWNVQNDNEADACAAWSCACGRIDPAHALTVTPLFNKALRVTTWP
jgi:crossover junction endodeoxyribonuclease RuvC